MVAHRRRFALTGCVHRLGPDLLEKELPKRSEFAIFFRLSPEQEALYEKFIEVAPSTFLSLNEG
jgi:SNF2 family DNA or RNA helicase